MRSRPDVKVYLDPPQPCPGDRLRVKVVLESKSETPYDAVQIFPSRASRHAFSIIRPT